MLLVSAFLVVMVSTFPVLADYYDEQSWETEAEWEIKEESADTPETEGQWNQTEQGWVYYDNDGNVKTGWFMNRGHWYYSETNGIMIGNAWITGGGKWYRVSQNGDLLEGHYEMLNDDDRYYNTDSLQWEQATLYAGKYDFEYSNGACNKNPMEKPFDGKYTYASDANGDALKVGDTIILLDLAGAGLYGPYGHVVAIDGVNFQVYWYEYINMLYGTSCMYEFYTNDLRGIFTGVYDIPSYGWYTSAETSGIYKR